MAWETGTATDYDDLLDKLKTFLTATMTPVAERWTVLADNLSEPNPYSNPNGTVREIYFQGPGIAALDEVNVNIRRYSVNVTGGTADNWEIRGAVNYDAGLGFNSQPGVSGPSYTPSTDIAMTYYFVATGRFFYVMSFISTRTLLCGGGFYLPDSLPSEFPYPIFVLGTTGAYTDRWSVSNYGNLNFYNRAHGVTSSSLRHRDGHWLPINRASGNVKVFPNHQNDNAFGVISNQDDPRTYTLIPFRFFSSHEGGNVYGETQNLYFVSGFSNAALNVIRVSGVDYLVMQNVWRTDYNGDFAAIKLE